MTINQPEHLKQFLGDNGITVVAEFVPFSQSRNAKPDPKPSDLSLNWKVTVRRNDHDVLTTDYMQGIGHAASYKQGQHMTMNYVAMLEHEAETGKRARNIHSISHIMSGKPLTPPSATDVLCSLAVDSDVLDYSTFEEWAHDLGYDTDSRKAESIYRACLEIALKLRNGLGDSTLAELRDATQDY